ncbi:hypothetical protein, partial [Escherichia coli]|uniref:hypothetical protein n=1 Tax=Escherichia coli TaxID=562 RepID=UPI0019632757
KKNKYFISLKQKPQSTFCQNINDTDNFVQPAFGCGPRPLNKTPQQGVAQMCHDGLDLNQR